ncbi:F0F1 ATP synthase subunit B [Xylanimonas protaetiae]|uniref:ATP synthase subunit b n=1 Tax=Xylanimonas protaetiae TaxID=2509457 RepID=A0A4P6F0T6_9MICO|nr:F0F1 ATP synthase subunit B [Xylanimonas protaetiae]QAY68816.1 F0F1 ATP synthase subunit B [Xylanimonas protaetiae]
MSALQSAALVMAAEEEHQGIDLFLPEPADLFWSLVVLVLIGVVFYKFVLPKMTAILDERSEKIEGGLAKAEQAQAAAADAREQGEALLAEARHDAARTRDEAREDGKAIVAEHRVKAQEEAARIAEAAQRQVEAERQAAAVSLRTEVGDLATQLASKIVGEELADSAARARVVDRFLDDLETQQTVAAGRASREG